MRVKSSTKKDKSNVVLQLAPPGGSPPTSTRSTQSASNHSDQNQGKLAYASPREHSFSGSSQGLQNQETVATIRIQPQQTSRQPQTSSESDRSPGAQRVSGVYGTRRDDEGDTIYSTTSSATDRLPVAITVPGFVDDEEENRSAGGELSQEQPNDASGVDFKQCRGKLLLVAIVSVLLLCIVIVVPVVLLTAPKTTPQDTLKQVACDFLTLTPLSECLATSKFDAWGSDRVTGSTIPSEIGLLTQLTYLSLYGEEKLTGTVPESISSLTRLMYLSFSGNNLSKIIPESLSALTKLTHLDMSENMLSSTIPESFSVLTRLTLLDLQTNRLTGTIPSGFWRFTNAEVLDFQGNALSGTIPNSLCGSGRVIRIDCLQVVCQANCCIDNDSYC